MMALAEDGRLAEARAILHSVAPGPEDYRWLYTQCWCLLAAARIGDREPASLGRAAQLGADSGCHLGSE
jgi:hypothetical protein